MRLMMGMQHSPQNYQRTCRTNLLGIVWTKEGWPHVFNLAGGSWNTSNFFFGALGPYHSDTLSPPNGTCSKLKKPPKQNIAVLQNSNLQIRWKYSLPLWPLSSFNYWKFEYIPDPRLLYTIFIQLMKEKGTNHVCTYYYTSPTHTCANYELFILPVTS